MRAIRYRARSSPMAFAVSDTMRAGGRATGDVRGNGKRAGWRVSPSLESGRVAAMAPSGCGDGRAQAQRGVGAVRREDGKAEPQGALDLGVG